MSSPSIELGDWVTFRWRARPWEWRLSEFELVSRRVYMFGVSCLVPSSFSLFREMSQAPSPSNTQDDAPRAQVVEGGPMEVDAGLPVVAGALARAPSGQEGPPTTPGEGDEPMDAEGEDEEAGGDEEDEEDEEAEKDDGEKAVDGLLAWLEAVERDERVTAAGLEAALVRFFFSFLCGSVVDADNLFCL